MSAWPCVLPASVSCLLLMVEGCMQGMAGTVPHDYGLALQQSMQFYQAQKSGSLVGANRVSYRASSALSDVPLGGFYLGKSEWRGARNGSPACLGWFAAWSLPADTNDAHAHHHQCPVSHG